MFFEGNGQHIVYSSQGIEYMGDCESKKSLKALMLPLSSLFFPFDLKSYLDGR